MDQDKDLKTLRFLLRLCIITAIGVVTYGGSFFVWVLPRMGRYQAASMDLPYYPGSLERFGDVWQFVVFGTGLSLIVAYLVQWRRLVIVEVLWAGALLGMVIISTVLVGWELSMAIVLAAAAVVVYAINKTTLRAT